MGVVVIMAEKLNNNDPDVKRNDAKQLDNAREMKAIAAAAKEEKAKAAEEKR